MAYEAVDCVDAGTEYCPCYLAETNNCLICSQLQGKLFCDCINWKGVCIYQEYVWNRNKRKESRETLDAKVLEKYYVNDRVIFIKLKVTRTLARELNQPGSYVFIRNVNDPEFFDVPMSVMYSDEVAETADMLIQIRGVKTKSLEDVGDLLLVRGPYWNGILGLKNLKSIKDKNCLIIARGIAQAASVLAAKKLCYSGNNVYYVFVYEIRPAAE
jgi:NAD(P)H-flavin reductase